MKKYVVLSSLFCLTAILSGQVPTHTYHRVKVSLHQKDLGALLQLGIEVDHGTVYPGKYLINDFSTAEIESLQEADFEVELLIEDVVSYYQEANRAAIDERSPTQCYVSSISDYERPENFTLGSMGGFFTYQEMLDQLDAMRAKYPQLITARAPIRNHITSGGNRIFWLRISDNPEVQEAEPEVLYTALHHAREPNSLAQLIFYMWYLLENYEEDEEIRYLLNNTALYFVPCVNPDGYLFNQQIEPDGGGLWRKNRRVLADGFVGVDLNRNYGFQWGFDNSGSSPNPQSDVFRGTAPFSEVETRAIRDFCQDHNFRVALNCHTYGKLLVYPWGYLDTLTPDADLFTNWAKLYTLENNYLAGTGTQTVGYTVNGDADDWMYGALDIISMTPEVGGGGQKGGFWPDVDQIIPNCQASMWMNLSAVRVLHRFGLAQDAGPSVLSVQEPFFTYELKRYGLEAGPLRVQLRSLTPTLEVTLGAKTYSNLDLYETVQDKLPWRLLEEVKEGELVQFELSVDNGSFTIRDTISKLLHLNAPYFADNLTDAANWQQGANWGLTSSDFITAPNSMSDSPWGNYANDANNSIETKSFIQVPEFETAYLNFWAKWSTESDFDFVQVQMAVNDGEFIPLCGQYSDRGTSHQREGQPLYDGAQLDWVNENIPLHELLAPGDSFKIRFELVSDRFITADGFYFDDLKVFFFGQDTLNAVEMDQEAFEQGVMVFPNPAQDHIRIKWTEAFAHQSPVTLQIFTATGRLIHRQAHLHPPKPEHLILLQDWAKGAYWGLLRNAEGKHQTFQLILQD